MFRVYRLQRPVPELAIVADSFHTKPLLRILQSADRYQVLALTATGRVCSRVTGMRWPRSNSHPACLGRSPTLR